jgi:RND family efflux transporter MFP subunit
MSYIHRFTGWRELSQLVLLALPLVACTPAESERRERADVVVRPVRVAPIADTVAGPTVIAPGTVAARDELELSFKVGGVIASVPVDAGDRVHAGQVLATLALPEVDAQVAKATAALEKAERDAARVQRLAAESVATRTQADDAETALEVAQADYEAARFNRRHAVITAPAAGTILRRLARPGENVSAGATVLVLASAGRGFVFHATVPDRDLVRLREGDRAAVRLDAWPGREFPASVLEKGAAPAARTGAYTVTLALPDADLPSGLVGTATIAARGSDRVRLVPTEALVEGDGREGIIFVLGDSSRVERRRVTIAFVRPGVIGIASGLDGAKTVVTEGAPYLEDGEAVEVLP